MPQPTPRKPSKHSVPTPDSVALLDQEETEAPVQDRKDPPPRGIDAGWSTFNSLENADPRMRYVWVSLRDEETGVGMYQAFGYEEVRYEPGGVKPTALRKPVVGAPVEFRGQLLMQIPADEHAAIVAQGEKRTDAVNARMRTRDGMIDNSRGMRVVTRNDQYMVVKDTARFES